MNRVSPRLKILAESLLKYEGLPDGASANEVTAAFHVCEKLRRPLSNLAGAAGSRALLARALCLAKTENPVLSRIQIRADGSLEMLDASGTQGDECQLAHGEVILVANLLGLLVTFIGEPLTLGLIQGVWPQAVADGLTF